MSAKFFKDANELLKAGGASAVRAAIFNAAPYVAEKELDAEEVSVLPFPVASAHVFHGIAGEIANHGTLENEADPVAVLVQTLCFAGASIGRKPWLAIGESVHHARLFCAVVGATSKARKGTSAGVVDRIFNQARELFSNRGTPNQTDPGAIDPVICRQTHGPLSSGEGLIYSVRDKSDKLDKDGNTTDAGQPDKRLYVVEEELAAPLAAMKREGATLSAIIRCAYDGQTLEPLTKNNRLTATNPHVCIAGHVTFNELRKVLTSTSIHNGFANRFIWIIARRSKIMALPGRMADSGVDRLATKLGNAIVCAQQIERVALSSAASMRWREVYERIGEAGEPTLDAIMSRAEANVLRVALIYSLLDGAHFIELDHLVAALALWDYSKRSCDIIFGSNLPPDSITAKIIEALSTTAEMTTTDIRRALHNHPKPGALKQALEQLQARSQISGLERASRSGGRPATVWKLLSSAVSAQRAHSAKSMGYSPPHEAQLCAHRAVEVSDNAQWCADDDVR